MKRLSIKQLLIFIFIFSLGIAVCNGQSTGKGREPRGVTKAKKTQAKKEAKLEKDFKNYVDDSRKRAFKIQSPEVKARMIQNKKDIKAREKAKKKRTSTVTRKAGKKYK